MQNLNQSISTTDTSAGHHRPDMTWILSRIDVPGYEVLTERLRQCAKTFLRQESECLPRYEMVCVPGDHGRTERLRLYLRDVEYLLRGIPADRRMTALTHINAVLVRMWYQADYHVVDHERMMAAARTFFLNRTNKSYLTGTVATTEPTHSPEDDIEQARRTVA
jgi:hypothetical protein